VWLQKISFFPETEELKERFFPRKKTEIKKSPGLKILIFFFTFTRRSCFPNGICRMPNWDLSKEDKKDK
jgi:hypothetical protein